MTHTTIAEVAELLEPLVGKELLVTDQVGARPHDNTVFVCRQILEASPTLLVIVGPTAHYRYDLIFTFELVGGQFQQEIDKPGTVEDISTESRLIFVIQYYWRQRSVLRTITISAVR